jgi:hypothetical protein
MVAQALHRSSWSLVAFAAAVVLAGCEDETALGPAERPAIAASRGVDLGECDHLAAPQGSKLVFHAYAEGVQIYQWDGTTWAFRGPSANLYANAGGTGLIGTHYAGPTWESNGGQPRRRQAQHTLRGRSGGHPLASPRRDPERRARHLQRRHVHPAHQHGRGKGPHHPRHPG